MLLSIYFTFLERGEKEPVAVGQPDQLGKRLCAEELQCNKAIKEATNTYRTGAEGNWQAVGGPSELDIVREGQLEGVKVMKHIDKTEKNK